MHCTRLRKGVHLVIFISFLSAPRSHGCSALFQCDLHAQLSFHFLPHPSAEEMAVAGQVESADARESADANVNMTHLKVGTVGSNEMSVELRLLLETPPFRLFRAADTRTVR
jgi:hypothetical protein